MRKILVVEDHPDMLEVLTCQVEMMGFSVIPAKHGKEGVTKALEEKPDLILMDIMMPDQDGISLTRDIRNDPKTSDIPILVVSGLDDAATLGDALLFGAVDYVVKPVELEDLKVKIEHTFSLVERRKKKQAA